MTRPIAIRRLGTAVGIAAVVATATLDASPDSAADRGRALFMSGRHADGRTLVGRAGNGTVVPAAFVACANCHGPDARGKFEGGLAVPDIRWDELTKPYVVAQPGERTRAPYDATRFHRAVAEGVDSRGNALASAMPRFEMSSDETADLIAFLQNPTEAAGVTANTIHLGFTRSAGGAGDADERLLRAWANGINARGGIFRRRIELAAQPAESETASVLALVALDRLEATTVRACEQAGIPHLAVTAADPTDAPHGFAFLPSPAERVALLVRHALDHAAGRAAVAVVYPDGFAVAELARRLGATAAAIHLERYDPAAAAALAPRLVGQHVRTVVLAGPLADFAPVLEGPGDGLTFLGLEGLNDRPTLPNPIYALRCANVAEPAPGSPRSSAETRAPADRAAAIAATLKLLEQALADSGRELRRERLRDALEALREVRTDGVPAMSFGTRRHVAASGLYLVTAGAVPAASAPVWLSLRAEP